MLTFKKIKARCEGQGGISEMVTIAVPIVVSQACYTLMIFTDRLFLSRLGPEVMNASMGGGLTAFMMITFFLGLTSYATALTAQYFGAGIKGKSALVVTQALIVAVLAYPIILSCRPLAHMLFDVVGVGPLQVGPQKIYFNILLYGTVIVLLRNCFSSFFSGIGRTKIVMMAAFTAMSVNVGVNYVLIFGKFGMPALGIRGAAYGTIIGSISALAVLVKAYYKKGNRQEYGVLKTWRYDRVIMKQLLKFGSPTGVEMFLNLLAFTCVVLIYHSKGLVTATAATIVFNWDMVAFLPLIGVEIAVTSLVGRYMGRGNPDIAHRSVMSGIKFGMIYAVVVAFFFVLFPEHLTRFFKPDVVSGVFMQAAPTAIFMIRLASLYVVVDVMIFVFIGALRGAGDTFWAMCYTLILHWVLVPVIFIALRVLGMSAEAGWVLLVFIFVVSSVFVYLRYRGGKWRGIKVIQAEEPPIITGDVAQEIA